MKKISFNDYIPEELADNESCRLITTEQYREYLKLKEEHKPLSWEELKEEAKKMGYEYDDIDYGYPKLFKWCEEALIYFYSNGEIMVDGATIAKDRTPDQMLAIMKALQ